jgi:fructokinase
MTVERQPLVIGEILFDCFPGGERVPGGAPFNVAWNLRGLGLHPRLVSAVGDDGPGHEMLDLLQSWRLDPSGVRIVPRWPTGSVRVWLEDGHPRFEIPFDQAWDHLEPDDRDWADPEPALVYHGSLIWRHETSRATVRRLVRASSAPRFVDINIRQPWFDREWLEELFGETRWIKLSHDELAWISDRACDSRREIEQAVAGLRQRFGGHTWLVTRGENGAGAIDADGEALFATAPPPAPVVDTVGAGDAFSAAAIAGILRGDSLERVLESAVGFAAKACTIRGATTADPRHYQLGAPG